MLEQNSEFTEATRSCWIDGALHDQRRLPPSAPERDFGDRYGKDDCAACDVCLGELEAAPEPIVIARKILSCVVRVGQRFGAHVASVLRGQTTEQIVARQHDTLSTFGCSPTHRSRVRGYIEQLIGLGPSNRRCVSGVEDHGDGHHAAQR